MLTKNHAKAAAATHVTSTSIHLCVPALLVFVRGPPVLASASDVICLLTYYCRDPHVPVPVRGSLVAPAEREAPGNVSVYLFLDDMDVANTLTRSRNAQNRACSMYF